MSSSTSIKPTQKTYAAAACPPRVLKLPAVARLSIEERAPAMVATEPFPSLPSPEHSMSPLGKRVIQ